MKINVMKEKLKKGQVALGAMIQEPASQLVEILGLLGFDWLLIDCEHSPLSLESVAQLIMAAELRRLTPLVRVPQNLPEIVLRYMDIGAMGVVIPDMDSRNEAIKAVKGVKFPPDGERGLSGTRIADFGLKGDLGEYVRKANSETIVLGLIESREGIAKVEEILTTDGLDGVIIGTNDLSKSLGIPGQTKHPLVLEAIEKVLGLGRKVGKPVGAGVHEGETPKIYVEKGFQIISIMVSSLIISAGKQFLENGRS